MIMVMVMKRVILVAMLVRMNRVIEVGIRLCVVFFFAFCCLFLLLLRPGESFRHQVEPFALAETEQDNKENKKSIRTAQLSMMSPPKLTVYTVPYRVGVRHGRRLLFLELAISLEEADQAIDGCALIVSAVKAPHVLHTPIDREYEQQPVCCLLVSCFSHRNTLHSHHLRLH